MALAAALVAGCSCESTEDGEPGTGGAGAGTSTSSSGTGGTPILVEFTDELDPLPLHVHDEANVASHGSPVSGGIPLPRGALPATAVERLALGDEDGYRVVPFGASALGTWPDGSVKWLLVDFPATLDEDASRTFDLGLIEAADDLSTHGIQVTEEADRYVVDTGALQVELSRTAFGFIDAAWVDGDGDGAYGDDEQVVEGPGEMFIDLDDAPPGAADAGVDDHPDTWSLGIEGGNWLRDSEASSSTRYLASQADYSIELYRQTPAQTVFKLSGWHRQDGGSRQFATYSLYLHFYAGSSVVRAHHTWIMTGDPETNFIRRMAIEVPVSTTTDPLDYAFGGPYETEGTPLFHDPADPPFVPVALGPSEVMTGTVDASSEVALVAIGPDKYYHNVPLGDAPPVDYALLLDGTQQATGSAPAGWGDISNGELGAAVGVRDFWREHPKEVQYRDGRMAVYLWPDHGDKTLDLRRRYPELRGTVAQGWGKAARREFVAPGSAVGVAKSTDLFFYFHAGDHGAAAVDDHFRRFQDPLRPFVSGEHNVATGVYGPLSAYDPTSRPQIENYLDHLMARIIRSKREYGWVGMFDYGDYLPEYEKQEWELDIPWNPFLYSNWGYAGWLQENYRFGQWAFVQYLRSGRYGYFRAADTWLRHARDVDCVFWDAPDDGPAPGDNDSSHRRGGGHRHDQQHWGAYMASYGIPTIAVIHHYYLTGDGRDLDAARDYVDWLSGSGSFYENYGEYAVLYLAEALKDQEAIDWAMAHDETPQSAYGRATYDSGMGLMLRDIHTNGESAVRERLRSWADLDEATAAYLRAYLESVEGEGTYTQRIQDDWDAAFPASAIQASRYEPWAPRIPADFRDAFSADIMPDGPWTFPIRTLESMQFDGPGGMGNDLGRHSNQLTLMWLMPHVP
ncbi:MAG: hypothetical protein JRI68_03050 [Deltaproteobacteria bacterium]|nr:hypothetical protein [Deltaproteobacteria bacterium]